MKGQLSEKLRGKLDNLSKKPGVYLFKNRNNDIIYIGKAKILRNRVRSYFQDSRQFETKLLQLVARISDFDTIITDTEVEALILEATLIKEHCPRYNINLKDDKSFPYIRVTNEPFPRIFPTRKIVHDGSKYFGPYTDVQGMRSLLNTIKRIFPIRSCKLPLTEKSIADKKYKVCLNYHIHRCFGPCQDLITQKEYKQTIDYIVQFIKGFTKNIEDDIKQRMQDLASELKFEQAARLRDQLKSIEMFSQRQKVLDPQLADRDIIATAVDDEDACCVIFKVRQGKIIAKDFFFLNNHRGENIQMVTKSFIEQYYLQREDSPPEILLPVDLGEETTVLENWLGKKASFKVHLKNPLRGEKARLVKMCTRNARFHLEGLLLKKLQSKEYIAGSVKALKDALHLEVAPRRIEGFDISNIQGTDPVASMVCFINGRPAKTEYRHYKIRAKSTPDDFLMMNEAVKRRYTRVLKEKKPLPDLILIDGGKGQLNAALSALREVGLEKQTVIALAKKLDQIYIPGVSDPQNISRASSRLKLLQRVRDESHRFAVTFHRKIRQKRTLTSELDAVPGIGDKRKKALLKYFGGIENIKMASVDEICKVKGISVQLAKEISSTLKKFSKGK